MQLHAMLAQASQCQRQVEARRKENRQMIQPGRSSRRRVTTGAVPGVKPDVVMVATRGKKRGLRTHPLHEVESEHVTIKADGSLEIGNLEVNVTDAGVRRKRRHGKPS